MNHGLIEIQNLNVFAGEKQLLRNITLRIEPLQIFGIIGPSGAGKSTLLRCLNRLIELDSGLRVTGEIRLDGTLIHDPSIDVDTLRTRVGMIFQQPVVFPISIFRNVIFGVRHTGRNPRSEWPQIAETSLKAAALWDEVKDRLHESALKLSVGQQQRLCLARTLAVQPQVILLDEPTSSLDPASTELIEDLLLRLKKQKTLVLVTHNLAQAVRVTDNIARLEVTNSAGEILACEPASTSFAARPR